MKLLKKISKFYVVGLTFSCAMSVSHAAGHYVPGVEGIEISSAPPPGFYNLDYFVNYSISSISGAPGNNSGNISAVVERPVWITNQKILGANYGMEAVIPLQANSFTFNGLGYSGTSRGLGDIYVGPVVLAWHGANWDTLFLLGEWLDSGRYSKNNPSSVGLGYNGTMVSLGGTYYIGAKKEWSLSALARLEKNSVQQETGITPGNEFTVEWGIGHSIGGGKKIGLVGYYQEQTTSDSGLAASSLKPKKSGVGLEFDYPILSAGVFLKFAGYTDYAVSGGAPKGNLLRVEVVKAF